MTSPNTPTNNESKRNIGALGATGVVVAAMIGTGIFTLSGVVGPDLVTTDRFVVAWIVAAIVAGLGGSVYSELAAANPNTGGHYLYWRTTFGRQATFIQCATDLVLVSVASVAAVAAGSAAYLHPLLPSAVQGILGESGLAVALIWIATAMHIRSVRFGSAVITVGAMAKVAILLVFCVLVFLSDVPSKPAAEPLGTPPSWFSPTFADAVLLVLFAYAGWENATTVAGDVQNPQRNVPLALFGGLAAVTVVYLLVNFAFLRAAPPSAMIDADGNPVEAIGLFTAEHLLPSGVAEISGLVFGVLIFFTIISATLVVSRLFVAFAERRDFPSFFAHRNEGGTPVPALVVNAILCSAFLTVLNLEQLIRLGGITYTLSHAGVGVAAVVQRLRSPDQHRPFRMPLFPVPAIVFALLYLWLGISGAIREPELLPYIFGGWIVAALLERLGRRP